MAISQCFKRRLIATAKNLKKKQQQLQADQDLLIDRWTKVLAVEEYGLNGPAKNYPKRKLLPQFDDEALEPIPSSHNAADRPPRGQDKAATQAEHQTAHLAVKARIKQLGVVHTTFGRTWTVEQDTQDRSTDREDVLLCKTINVTPDTVKVNPAGPNTAGKTHPSCVTIYPNTEAPHTPYASQTK